MKRWLLFCFLLNLFYLGCSQNTAVPKWLQDSWTAEYTRYHDYDIYLQSPIQCTAKVTITKDYVDGKCSCRGSSTVYFKGPIVSYDGKKLWFRDAYYGKHSLLIDSYNKYPYEQTMSSQDVYSITWPYKRDSEIVQEKQRKQEEYERQLQEARQREQEKKIAEQREKERLKKLIDGYNYQLDTLKRYYNSLLSKERFNVKHKEIISTYTIESNISASSARRQFSQYEDSIKTMYGRIKRSIRNDYEREFNNKYNLFKSREEFDNAYTSKNYQEIVLKKLNTVVVADIQGKWRQVVRKADRNYMRLIIIDKTIKIKKATKTVYKGGFKIDDGISKKDEAVHQIIKDYLKKGISPEDIAQSVILYAGGYMYLIIEHEGEGKYYPIGFERYYGTDEKIAWYVTKKVLLYTGISAVALIATPYFWTLVL